LQSNSYISKPTEIQLLQTDLFDMDHKFRFMYAYQHCVPAPCFTAHKNKN